MGLAKAQGMAPGFVQQLMHRTHLAQLEPNNVRFFKVKGQFGEYQIKIGPIPSPKSITMPVTIDGMMDHLYIVPEGIQLNPSSSHIQSHLKGCTMAHRIHIRIKDSTGTGGSVDKENPEKMIQIEKIINFGKNQNDKVEELKKSGKFAHEAYQIIQGDILNSLFLKGNS